jgi:hypothetical protein
MYALIINDVVEKFSYSIGQLRKDNPQTSFPKNPTDALLAEWNVFNVEMVPQPVVNYTKNVGETVPQKQNGKWVQVWNVSDASAEEVQERTDAKATEVRVERNNKLTITDWTQIADAPVDKTKWVTYRQALRDVTQQSGFPWTITWPTQPE